MNTSAPSTILILYSSRFGQCQRIAEKLTQSLEALGRKCDTLNIETMRTPPKPVPSYESVIITASIRYGYFHKNVGAFVRQHHNELQTLLDVFIPVNLIARNPQRRTLERNAYARKFLEKTNWSPKIIDIMAGALLYPRYNFFDRFMIRLIMKMTNGETDTSKEIEYTDWDHIPELATEIDTRLREKNNAIENQPTACVNT